VGWGGEEERVQRASRRKEERRAVLYKYPRPRVVERQDRVETGGREREEKRRSLERAVLVGVCGCL